MKSQESNKKADLFTDITMNSSIYNITATSHQNAIAQNYTSTQYCSNQKANIVPFWTYQRKPENFTKIIAQVIPAYFIQQRQQIYKWSKTNNKVPNVAMNSKQLNWTHVPTVQQVHMIRLFLQYEPQQLQKHNQNKCEYFG